MFDDHCWCSNWDSVHKHADNGDVIKLDSDRSTDERITDIEKDLIEIKSMLTNIKEILVKADKVIDTVGKEAGPTIQAIANHPMLKMLSMGKAK